MLSLVNSNATQPKPKSPTPAERRRNPLLCSFYDAALIEIREPRERTYQKPGKLIAR
jgi:hypothetical protein